MGIPEGKGYTFGAWKPTTFHFSKLAGSMETVGLDPSALYTASAPVPSGPVRLTRLRPFVAKPSQPVTTCSMHPYSKSMWQELMPKSSMKMPTFRTCVSSRSCKIPPNKHLPPQFFDPVLRAVPCWRVMPAPTQRSTPILERKCVRGKRSSGTLFFPTISTSWCPSRAAKNPIQPGPCSRWLNSKISTLSPF